MCYLYNIVSAEIYITFTFCCLVTFRSFMLYFILHVIIWTSCYPLPIILYFALHFKVCASCFTWPFMLYFVLHVILLSFMLNFCPSFYTLAFVLYFVLDVILLSFMLQDSPVRFQIVPESLPLWSRLVGQDQSAGTRRNAGLSLVEDTKPRLVCPFVSWNNKKDGNLV